MLSVHLCEEFNDHLENLGSEGSGQLNEIIKYSLLTLIIYIVLKFHLENSRHAFHSFHCNWLTQKRGILCSTMPLYINGLCIWYVEYNKAITKLCWLQKGLILPNLILLSSKILKLSIVYRNHICISFNAFIKITKAVKCHNLQKHSKCII